MSTEEPEYITLDISRNSYDISRTETLPNWRASSTSISSKQKRTRKRSDHDSGQCSMSSENDPLVCRSKSVAGEKETRRSRIFEESGRIDGTKSQIILEEVEGRGFKKSSVSLVEQTVLSMKIERSSCNIHALTAQHSSTITPPSYHNPSFQSRETQSSKKWKKTTGLIGLLLLFGAGCIGIGFAVSHTIGSTESTETVVENFLEHKEELILPTMPNLQEEKVEDLRRNSTETECSPTCLDPQVDISKGRLSCQNNTIILTCDRGFHSNQYQFPCDHAPDLKDLKCLPDKCSVPEDPKHGHIVCRVPVSYEVNATCQVDCQHGAGHESIRCQENLTWSSPPTCPPPSCPPLENKSELIVCTSTGDQQSGDQCTKKCSERHFSRLMTCEEGEWDYMPSEIICRPTCELNDVSDGYLDCGKNQEMFDRLGVVPHSAKCNLFCNAGFQLSGSSTLTCNDQGKWTSGKCEETVPLLAGGEIAGQITDSLQVLAGGIYTETYSKCLPPLPEKLRWGSMGLVEDNLLVCGGQKEDHMSRDCFQLKPASKIWTKHKDLLSSPRVKSAYSVSKDKTKLHIISGFSEYTAGGLNSLQSVGLDDWGEEQVIEVDGTTTTYTTLQASVVTLESGDLLVTGGFGQEQNTFFLDTSDITKLQRKRDMKHPRMGHSSARIVLDIKEMVIVAGGWDRRSEAQTSAEMYSPDEDLWEEIPSLPQARVDFTLKVMGTKVTAVGGYNGQADGPEGCTSCQRFPKVAKISWTKGKGWPEEWQQDEGQEDPERRRSKFMVTEVPLSWIKRFL